MGTTLNKALNQASGRWRGIYAALAPDLAGAIEAADRSANSHVSCPVHGGENGDGFRLFADWEDNGGGICNTCGSSRDGVAMLAWLNGWNYTQALRTLFRLLEDGEVTGPAKGASKEARQKAKTKAWEDSRRSANFVRQLWSEGIPMTAPEAEIGRRYFAHRGVEPYTDPAIVRFHPDLFYKDKHEKANLPGLLFKVQDSHGQASTIHRIYLNGSGRKADVAQPKKLAPVPKYWRGLTGGAIRLFAPGPELGITEGIENALAVAEATGIPVWPTINTALMESVEIPPAVKRVTVWVDKDRNKAGERAARVLRERMWAQGRYSGGYVPPIDIQPGKTSADWLDVYNRHGRSGFPERYVGSEHVEMTG